MSGGQSYGGGYGSASGGMLKSGGGFGINPPPSGFMSQPGRMGFGSIETGGFTPGGVMNQPGFNSNPLQGGASPFQQAFSYAPQGAQYQLPPEWQNGGWTGDFQGTSAAPPPNVAMPNVDKLNPAPGYVPNPQPSMPGGYTPAPGGVYNVPPATNPGTKMGYGGFGPAGQPGFGINPPPAPGPANTLTPLQQAVLTGQGGGNFTPAQLNQAGVGGQNYGSTLDAYKANQVALNRQGPMYRPGGMFYNPAIDGAWA